LDLRAASNALLIILVRSASEIGTRNSTPVSNKAKGSPNNALPEYRSPPVGKGAMPFANSKATKSAFSPSCLHRAKLIREV
jgi:hypothetical protein